MRILVGSPRVAPGLLTLEAWDALRAATSIRAVDLDDPHVQAIVNAGFAVEPGDRQGGYESGAIWIAPGGDTEWARELAAELMGAESQSDESQSDEIQGAESRGAEIIFGSYDTPGAKMLDLVDVMDQLRTHCPWTGQQTHASLSHYLLEEAHETLEALDSGDSDHLCEELGDLLMQVVFHARIAAETEGWDIDEVADGIVTKLIYRNPHVFGDEVAADADAVDARWQELKSLEKPRSSVLDGIAATLPALAATHKVLDRLGDTPAPRDDLGGRLIALVAEARASGLNAEEELRKSVRALAER